MTWLGVPKVQREYLRSHPGWPWVMVGILLSGIVGLVAPEAVAGSVIALVLPKPLLIAFNIVWVVGGGLGTFGIVRGHPRAEVPGLALIAGGLVSYYIAIVSVRAVGALQVLFILWLAVGCVVRAVRLVHCGYERGSP